MIISKSLSYKHGKIGFQHRLYDSLKLNKGYKLLCNLFNSIRFLPILWFDKTRTSLTSTHLSTSIWPTTGIGFIS